MHIENMEKPEDCIICYDKLGQEKPLPCGHYTHMACLKKHFKPECVMCRRPLNIKVTGQVPKSNIPWVPPEEDMPDLPDPLENILGDEEDEEIVFISDPDEPRPYKRKGYLYAEEDSDYDEENPLGDEVDYGDY
jgi:hypothetical protein